MFQFSRMRRHLTDCLEDQQMRHFPASRQQRRQTVRKIEKVQVYCKCRLQEEVHMIFGDSCDNWYNSTCQDIPEAAWAKHSSWSCSACNITVYISHFKCSYCYLYCYSALLLLSWSTIVLHM